jgi:hypothetical protein
VLTVESAKALRKAGLQWEPKADDHYYWIEAEGRPVLDCISNAEMFCHSYQITQAARTEKFIFAPVLEQLLAELKKHSEFVKITWLVMDKKWDCVIDARQQFLADSPEEAAAEALLWVLKKAGGANG